MPKFKVGDKVRVISNSLRYCPWEVGTICYILIIHSIETDGQYYRVGKEFNVQRNFAGAYECELELADTTGYYFNMVDTINNAYQIFTTAEEITLKDNCEKSPKNIMTTIKEFAKNLVLSTDEKLLRKHGLKDSCGNFTIDAKDLVIEKLTSDNVKYLIDIAEQKEKEEVKK